VSYSSISALQTSFEDMLALLMGSLQRPDVRLPAKLGAAVDQVVSQLSNNSVPNPTAIEALVPLALPYHMRLRTRVRHGSEETQPSCCGRPMPDSSTSATSAASGSSCRHVLSGRTLRCGRRRRRR